MGRVSTAARSPRTIGHVPIHDIRAPAKVHVSDAQLEQALVAGLSIREIGIQTGWSDATIRNRIKACRQLYGSQWGGGVSDDAPGPAEEMAELVRGVAPSNNDLQHVARHSMMYGMMQGTRDGAAIVTAARGVVESSALQPSIDLETETERRQRMLTSIVHALASAQ